MEIDFLTDEDYEELAKEREGERDLEKMKAFYDDLFGPDCSN